eukprot:224728-Rhodomonas_salina.1
MVLCAYARTERCPVLTQRMVLPGYRKQCEDGRGEKEEGGRERGRESLSRQVAALHDELTPYFLSDILSQQDGNPILPQRTSCNLVCPRAKSNITNHLFCEL